MPRIPVSTRPAVQADVPLLVGLWGELSQVGARAERAVNPVSVPDVAARLAEVIASDDCRVVVAHSGDEVVGMAVLRVVRPDPLSVHHVVQVSHVVVAAGKRRRGVGHALLAAAADFADERQVEHVSAGVYPSLRDVSRFYARLGFAPVMVQRVAPAAMLRRRLGAHAANPSGTVSDPAMSRMEDLVRRRTRIRRPVPAQRARQPERTD